MPAMMSLLVIMRRDMLASTRRAVAMLSSAPCSVSRACVIVCRCLWRSCRMLTPSSCKQLALGSNSVCLICSKTASEVPSNNREN